MNSINIMGRLTREPELKTLTSGTSVVSNTLAYNEMRNGEQVSMFFPFVAYGRTAELIDQHFKKGDLIGLTGKMTQRSYTNRDGEKREAFEIMVNEITFMPNDSGKHEVQKQVKEDFKEQARNKLGDIDKWQTVNMEEGDLPF